MSVSKTQMLDFAKHISDHPALNDFVARVDARIYKEFTEADTDEKRIKVGNLYDGFTAVMQEVTIVLNEMKSKEDDK